MPLHLKQAVSVAATNIRNEAVAQTVRDVLADVRVRGDVAIREYSAKFDDWSPSSFKLTDEEVARIVDGVPQQVIDDIKWVQDQVRSFARHQRASITDFEVETLPGVRLGQRNIPIQSVGAYVPGGRYPLTASAHMTIVTAKVAGVPRVVACTPPIRGEVPAATVAAMYFAGADEIHLLGGIQAMAGLAIGTETMERVDLIAGPGNAYVAEAKRQLFGEVGIDLFAGPTETLVIADHTSDPFVAAVDLLSQAEHGPDSPAVLVSSDRGVADRVIEHIEQLLPGMPTRDFAEPAWRDHGQVIVVDSVDEAFEVADGFASEHVQVLTENPRRALERMTNFGALFLGEGTCVSYGDKVIGTNHVLPTRGSARFTGGLWVGKYLKTVTYQEVLNQDSSALLGEVCGRASRVELFEGHARSGDVRVAKYAGAGLTWSDHNFEASLR